MLFIVLFLVADRKLSDMEDELAEKSDQLTQAEEKLHEVVCLLPLN